VITDLLYDLLKMESQLKARILDDLKQAMRSGDEIRKRMTRQLNAMIKNDEINARTDGRNGVISEADVLTLVRREIKQHDESILDARNANRQDIIDEQEAELVVLREYLPKQLSREEVLAIAQATIGELGVTGAKAHGQVMKAMQPKVKDIADGKLVNEVVRELLGS
jgi:uncharacterized protein